VPPQFRPESAHDWTSTPHTEQKTPDSEKIDLIIFFYRMISKTAFFDPENIDLRPKNGIVFDLIPHRLSI